ncbi:MAG: hypothetical protein NTV06_04100, partial [candidate division Zixibacteria bacterium]|nr:hypothetical protein [candidate division Zixibacteria bacterium]
ILSGGSNEGLSLFGRKEKVTEQEKILAELRTEINDLKEARNKVTAFLAARQAEVKSITLDIEKQKEDAERIEKELTTRGFELQTAKNELLRVDKARQILSEKLELLRNRQYNLTLNYDQLAQEKKTLAGKLNEHDLKIGELEKKSEEIQSQLSSIQIRQIELKSKRQQLESQIRHTKELMAEIEATARSKSAEIATASDEIKGSEEKTFLLEKELKATFDSRSSLIEKQTDIRQAHSSLQDDLTIREKEIKNLRQSREEGLNHLHSSELRLTEIDSEIRALVERIRDEYDTDLETIEVKAPDPNIPIEKAVDKTTELKEMLKNFGAVNLLALEEYHTYKERQEFLTAQMNDLLNAKSTLQSTMTKINVTAKNLFKETFEKVRGNFKLVFEELFTGGDADIQLLDPEDPLESPIEITARPRGKRLLSIAQMSGGERALTAISLLFAIYLVKPSPFCILDEIDAPLDDANIHRFLKMIKSFSDQTQFIIITHNKITMNAADILYGVTMEQPGISRVVSVRFNEDEESLIDSSLDAVDHHPQHTISESAENRIIVDIDQPTEEHNTE